MILPAYKEEDVLPKSVERFCKIAKNYKGKVKLYVTVEEDDKETKNIAEKLDEEYENVKTVVVPKEYFGGVGGKPRALNYAFKEIEKEIRKSKREENSIIGVIDAEDIISENLFDGKINNSVLNILCGLELFFAEGLKQIFPFHLEVQQIFSSIMC